MANIFEKMKNKWENLVMGDDEKISPHDSVQNPENKITNEPEVKAAKIDFIALQEKLGENIIANLKSMIGTTKFNPMDYILEVYINDTVLYQSCLDDGFKTRLADDLHMHCKYVFNAIEIKEGSPATDIARKEVLDQVYMCLVTISKVKLAKRARITALADSGSLVTDEIILDSQEIVEFPNERMNIGIGRTPRLDIGIVRINQIAIDDNPDGKYFEFNKYVSRAHAYIKYSEKEGFVLTVEPGGTKVRNHRTMVYRGTTQINLNVAGMGIPLQNGDQIVLSRNVILYFELLKD